MERSFYITGCSTFQRKEVDEMIEMCYYAVLTWFEVPLFNGISLLYGLELGYNWWEILLTTPNPLIPC
jgi:hypothetical protein